MPKKGLKIQYEECLYPKLGQCHVEISHSRVHGYPRFMREGKLQFVSRYVYEKYKGRIPEGLFVLHLCDNRGCINPVHLYTGTQQDNINDMFERGRARKARGEEHGRAKLTENQVKEIAQIKDRTLKEIALAYNVSIHTIWAIKRKITWRYLVSQYKKGG